MPTAVCVGGYVVVVTPVVPVATFVPFVAASYQSTVWPLAAVADRFGFELP